MKFIIYGTGGVGGYFGTRLAQAGNDVTFIARGKHLAAIQNNGLQLKSINGNYHLKDVKATDDVSTVSNPDVILIATKTWQLEDAAKTIKPILNENTMVISLLNGADNADKLSEVIDKKHVLGGLCRIFSKIEDYGVINHMSTNPYIAFGELDNTKTDRVLDLLGVFLKADIYAKIAEDIQVAIWTKFMLITITGAIGGLTRVPFGIFRSLPETRNIVEQTANEVLAVAKGKGINLTQQAIDQAMKFIDMAPFKTTTSLQRDIINSKPSELESQVGTIHRLGKKMNIETPACSFLYQTLLPQEMVARKLL